MYTVYVLYSPSHDKLYIGYTSNLTQRLQSHNETGNGFTSRYRPWEIIHTEVYETKKTALKREKSLKGGQGRQWIRENLLKLN